MEDNSTQNLHELLIKYLDKELNEEEQVHVQTLLEEDVEAREMYENILLSRDIVRNAGLRARVKNLQQEYEKSEGIATPFEGKVVRGNFSKGLRKVIRVAAIVILILAFYSVFRYMNTTNEKVYANNFIAYKLTVSRGEVSNETGIDSLYISGNYDGVVNAVAQQQTPTQKEMFLAGIAYLEKNNANKAIDALKNVQELNKQQHAQLYSEEADYYLLLAYIKAGNIDAAQLQLHLILADKNHAYYQKAKDISSTDLKILKMKK